MPQTGMASSLDSPAKVPREALTGKDRQDPVSPRVSLHNHDVRPLPVVLGIDFGTSSTKAVIRVPYYTGSPTYAVPLSEMDGPDASRLSSDVESPNARLSKYILATRISVDNDGQCFLSSTSGLSTFANLKHGLMYSESADELSLESGLPDTSSAVVRSTAYLALVLRRIIDWFDRSQKQIFGMFTYDWMMNMGLPAAIDDKTYLRNRFKLVARAAWLASVRPGNISLSHCQQAIFDISHCEISSDEHMISDIALIPEVIAQAVGYARSQSRNDGLHLLVDVGAGTLDVCSFNLYSKDDKFQWPVLTADVQPLGTIHLHDVRMKAALDKFHRHFGRWGDVTDPMIIFSSSVEDYLPDQQSIRDSVWKSQRHFEMQCRSIIGSAIIELKKTRYPNSPDWFGSVPIFVCGGGATLGPYQESIDLISKWMKKYFRSSQGLKSEILPIPHDIIGDLEYDSYHRLSVAYGLSYPPFDIGDYTIPRQIEDVEDELSSDNNKPGKIGASEHGPCDKEVQ